MHPAACIVQYIYDRLRTLRGAAHRSVEWESKESTPSHAAHSLRMHVMMHNTYLRGGRRCLQAVRRMRANFAHARSGELLARDARRQAFQEKEALRAERGR